MTLAKFAFAAVSGALIMAPVLSALATSPRSPDAECGSLEDGMASLNLLNKLIDSATNKTANRITLKGDQVIAQFNLMRRIEAALAKARAEMVNDGAEKKRLLEIVDANCSTLL